MHILGISAYHRDAAAALLVEGQPVAAAREEWFSRDFRDAAFPSQAIRFCLETAGIRGADLDHVVFYEKPLRKFERVVATRMRAFPRSARSFAHDMFAWLGDRLWVKNRIVKELDIEASRVLFTEHQLALAANAFFTSPFDEAAVLTVDDVGEWATAALGFGHENEIAISSEIMFPHSLGLLTAAITQFLGFTPGEDEHKVEALAALGEPAFLDAMRALSHGEDGLFTIDPRGFRFDFDAEQLFDPTLEERLGPPRYSGDPLCFQGDTRHADIAASLQRLLAEQTLALANRLYERHPSKRLCFAGELAANSGVCAGLRDAPFDDLFVPAATGKAGGALGAALYVHHVTEGQARTGKSEFVHLGPAIEASEDGRTCDPVAELAQRIRAGECVAWVRERMEFADHSVGRRIVLARADDPTSRPELLSALQHTEPFLRCRIAVPADRPDLHAPRPVIVDAAEDPEFHALLASLDHPVVLLADLRRRGFPIAHDTAAAIDVFERSSLDALVIGDRVLTATATTLSP